MLGDLLTAIGRRKTIDTETVEDTKLNRVLTVFDLTALGVGATLGAGVYVLTGAVARDVAGPSVILSFLIAAITSVLAGLCYAEFGARVPKAGSGYVYSYVTVGECVAFVIGWNLILSYVIGAASVARAWTANFDALPFMNKSIETFMRDCCAMDSPGLAEWPDVFSFVIIMVLTALIAFGVKEFATVNKIFTVLNVFVIIFVIIAGLTKADLHNWGWTPEEIYNTTCSVAHTCSNMTTAVSDSLSVEPWETKEFTKQYGEGGFMPFSVAGMVSGTATCFYAFVGFDCIATTGEEAINPQRSIPLGIVFALSVCCIAYLGISSTLLLMQPYFFLDSDAPLPYAFEYAGIEWAKYPVAIGAICALSTSLLGAMFPMPRIIYAMADDGLLFKFFASVHPKTKTPLIATFVSGAFAGIMAVLFDLKELVDLMSIGTLAAYTLVALSVLILRYQPDEEADLVASDDEYPEKKGELMSDSVDVAASSFSVMMLIRPQNSLPTATSSSIVNWCSSTAALGIVGFSVVARTVDQGNWQLVHLIFAAVFAVTVIACGIVIFCQPQSSKELSFQVPLVPCIPLLNMWVNIYLMVFLPVSTWYKMLVWMVLGFLIYFFYGIAHSTEGKKARNSFDGRELKEIGGYKPGSHLLEGGNVA